MSYYRCPKCNEGQETDKTKQEGKTTVRQIFYGCGSLTRLIFEGVKYREKFTQSEHCSETSTKDIDEKNRIK